MLQCGHDVLCTWKNWLQLWQRFLPSGVVGASRVVFKDEHDLDFFISLGLVYVSELLERDFIFDCGVRLNKTISGVLPTTGDFCSAPLENNALRTKTVIFNGFWDTSFHHFSKCFTLNKQIFKAENFSEKKR